MVSRARRQDTRLEREQASPLGRTWTRALCAHPSATLLVLLGLLYVPWIGALPLDGTLEGNRLEAAREMLHSGDWLVPRLGGTVYLAKPPFHPWTLALLSAPFGDVSLALGRALSAAAALGLCCLVFRWGRRELGRRAGLFAALALGASLLAAEKALRAELESELALLTGAALFWFFDAGQSAPRSARLLRIAAGLALGGAALTKGPPALIVFVATALATCWAARRRVWLVSAGWVLALALVCTLAWVVPVCARLGASQVWSALHEQFAERIVRAGRTNAEPFWFYGPALLGALLPASMYAPCLAMVGLQSSRDERVRTRAAFLWGWAFLPLILFSLSSGKEARYLLPTLPAWALLLAWGWTRARVALRFVRWRHALAVALRGTTWLAPLLWIGLGWRLFPEAFGLVVATALAELLARALIGWSVRSGRAGLLFVALAAAVGIAKIAWAETALAKKQREVPMAAIAAALSARLPAGEAWILVGPYRSWWNFSVNRPIRAVPDWRALRETPGPSARIVLSPARAIQPDESELFELGRWSVDGEEYRLVQLGP